MLKLPLATAVAALSLSLFGPGPSPAFELVLEKSKPDLNIGVYPVEANLWRSQRMGHPAATTDADRVWSGPDFFESEYGKPADFSSDIVAEHGYHSGKYEIENGALVAHTGDKGFSFGFGGIPGNLERPSVRLGASWGKNIKDVYRLRIVVEQNDVEATDWVFQIASDMSYRQPVPFKIEGKGRQAFELDVSKVRDISATLSQLQGFKLECKTPDATLRIDEVKLAPSSANTYFRRTFTLPDKPVRAHVSFDNWSVYDLYINGAKVDSGNFVYPAHGIRHVDLTPHLKAGANTIAYHRQHYFWAKDAVRNILFEGVAISRDGGVTRILADTEWKTTLKEHPNWMQADFDDSQWDAAKLAGPPMGRMWDNTKVADPYDPRHMGLLDVSPAGRQYPLFDHSEPATFSVRLPAGLPAGHRVQVEAFRAGTEDRVETASAGGPKAAGDFNEHTVALNTRKVGPYRLIWTLFDPQGQPVDTRRDELVIIGPVAQDRLPLSTFEQELEKRLTRVVHIDCTAEPDPDEFLDHAGMNKKPRLNLGHVRTANGMTYRETGPQYRDYFSYRLPPLERGKPHLVEIVVPDDETRTIYSGVVEALPLHFWNNPLGMGGWNTTGSAKTGAIYPLTNTLRKIRYVYYPVGGAAGVVVMNGLDLNRAAAAEINVYRIEGGLPALQVPESEREFGYHLERMTVNTRSLGSENPIEAAPPIPLNGHRDAWYHWYRIFERKIRWLRFQGQNMTVEGAYMYSEPHVPLSRPSEYIANQDFDAMALGIKMYAHNGIKVYLGFEYTYDPAYAVDGVDTTSDRRAWLGEPTLQLADKHGRSISTRTWGSANFLHPTVQKYFHGVIGEIHDRYKDVGPVAGVYMPAGFWWMPGFNRSLFRNQVNTDIGYDDYTVSMFERERGIKLDIDPHDPKRFGKRYDALMGQHKGAWMKWRAEKMEQALTDVRDIITKDSPSWKLLVAPRSTRVDQNPFDTVESTRAQRDSDAEDLYYQFEVDLDAYPPDSGIRMVPGFTTPGWQSPQPGSNFINRRGPMLNSGTHAAVRKAGAFTVSGALDEMDCPAGAADRWIWSTTARGVFIARGIEDNAMDDFVDVFAHAPVDTVIFGWIDQNLEMSFGPQHRRFAKALYATPKVDFEPLAEDRARGITAQIAPAAGGHWLRLINNTPYPVQGVVLSDATSVDDKVMDRRLTVSTDGAVRSFGLDLPANEMRVLFVTGGDPDSIRCDFAVTDDVLAQLVQRAEAALNDAVTNELLEPPHVTALRDAIAANDGPALHRLMGSWEIGMRIASSDVLSKAMVNQRKLLHTLQGGGTARINFGAASEYRDGEGNVWLSDQERISDKAYGRSGGTVVNRLAHAIGNTTAPQVYLSEIYGDKFTYAVPLPDGEYDVSVHFAETYAPNDAAGVRPFEVKVGAGSPDKIDIFKQAGGQFRAFVLKKPTVSVDGGTLQLEFGGDAVANGLSVKRSDRGGR
ncbi:MAG TPA: malectin domain-containing carbohydrate-binding protein [Tepidisphaeraceae bacterium]|jgi:hypothetical protein|nr:malectin domain-containing carbohydrate-binding protein [Tepidisphaeraceae bacterium]